MKCYCLNMRQLDSPLCGKISLYGVRRCPATCASSIRRCAGSSRCMASGVVRQHAPARFAAVRDHLAVWRPALSGNMRQLDSPLCGIISLYGVRRCPATCASSIRRCAASSRCMASAISRLRRHLPSASQLARHILPEPAHVHS